MNSHLVRIAARHAPQSFRAVVCPHPHCFTIRQSRHATTLPITATGPPPSAPRPEPSAYGERIDQKRRRAALLEKAKEIRQSQSPGSIKRDSPLRKRFWKDVHVQEAPEGYQIMLDTRPVRTASKAILTVPRSKPHLAHAIAVEWDLLVDARQALKNHNIPMTSIVARALDVVAADQAGDPRVRADIGTVMMRYLDTDTLLCWAPEKTIHEGDSAQTLDMEREGERARSGESLRTLQMKVAKEIIAYLNTSIWPGVEITPGLDGDSILPAQQSEVTRSVISGWISGLPAFELAALERAVLASKSLLIGARLLIEWSEEFRDVQREPREAGYRFGIEEAAAASTMEVRWQTGMWGEVEDTHDVDREDLRRQLGSAVLVVSGAK